MPDTVTPPDHRVQRTQDALRDAWFDLMIERAEERLTWPGLDAAWVSLRRAG